MKTTIVLAMHGAPPRDFPPQEMGEFMGLHSRHESGRMDPQSQARYQELDVRMRTWPRTPQNDPFHAASLAMAGDLSKAAGMDVIVGFNEFCAPDVFQALAQAVQEGADRVVVVTPMLTRGGEHSEKDIPETLEKARLLYPQTTFSYAWPVDSAEVAEFLAGQVRKHL